MDSLAGTQSFYEDAVDSRRKRTRLIVAVVLIALALAAAYYAFSASKRSEEHTSELQSLMRISYAVFCLKKKNKHNYRRTKNPLHRTLIVCSTHNTARQ